MKRTKRLLSLILIFALLFSTFEMVKFSAATDDTKYSKKYLQNGSFEDYSFDGLYSQPIKANVKYWDTTATDDKLEFFKGNSDKYHFKVTASNYSGKTEYLQVADGEIAAELNATQESTIYQRIKTFSGSTYTWGLYHRGRARTDRMVLFIGPEQYEYVDDNTKKAVDPSKPSTKGSDQFVRITRWLSKQYGIEYPDKGCSRKYIVYSKPFGEKGTFKDEDPDNENNNISLVETEEINQEWSVWVISSPYCKTNEENGKNGWSKYGTRLYEEGEEDFNDIIKGAGSKIGYDCTYTVPNGQTNTLFAFCSLSSGQEDKDDITYGNLLDGIKFDLYQPISSSITPGGIGGAQSDKLEITSNIIINGKSMHSVLSDGEECTIYTQKYNDGKLQECKFVGAYVTTYNDEGRSNTIFATPYEGDPSELTEEQKKNHFLRSNYVDDEGRAWQYEYEVSVESPVSIHLIYTKAPFVLYDSNGGKDYYFSPDNIQGGNLVGFGEYFIQLKDVVGGVEKPKDTSSYYKNNYTVEQTGSVEPGFYISHAALPNDKWDKNSDGTSPNKFCGWSISNGDEKQVILPGEHKVIYNPTEIINSGVVSFTDKNGNQLTDSEGNNIGNLQLDASNGITLTALWKFYHRAQAQTYTYNDEGKKWEFVNSAVGGYVDVTMMPDGSSNDDVKRYTQTVDDKDRVECVDAAGNAGDTIMFKATPDYENNYAFVGWYYREKQDDGTYKDELISVSSSVAVTVEEGKFNTYYARFQKKSNPVIFKYTSTGSVDGYNYYDITDVNRYGKYHQEVPFGATATKPTDDSMSVKTWFTSPTERGTEYIFDFENTPITKQTVLYAGPSFSYNYFNYFKLKEPWYINTYGTVKINGEYIDLINDKNVSDYNVYILKGTLDESAPNPSYIKENATMKVGKSVDNDKLIYNKLTNSGKTFNRAGVKFNDFYLFNMKTPVWVVFDFTYNGVKYTSTVKDRCLYNNITTYLQEASNGYYTDYPPEIQDKLREAQTVLLNSIKDIYDASPSDITEPTPYYAGATFDKSDYLPATEDNPYTFESTTAIRNIEPWGLKYSITVKNEENQIVTNFDDYGAVVFTDKDRVFDENSVNIDDLLDNENSVMYSKSKNNIYGENGEIEVCYVNNMLALDFDKNTYAVFFVKDSNGKCYYSNVVSNSYNSIAEQDTSDNAAISRAILNYSRALINYTELVKQPEGNNS